MPFLSQPCHFLLSHAIFFSTMPFPSQPCHFLLNYAISFSTMPFPSQPCHSQPCLLNYAFSTKPIHCTMLYGTLCHSISYTMTMPCISQCCPTFLTPHMT